LKYEIIKCNTQDVCKWAYTSRSRGTTGGAIRAAVIKAPKRGAATIRSSNSLSNESCKIRLGRGKRGRRGLRGIG
jgi:hypothetical protein